MNEDRLRRGDYEVRTVALSVCAKLVAQHHYARGGPNTATFRHGLFHRTPSETYPAPDEETCLGVAWWIPPTRAAAEATWPSGDWRRVLSLSRLVIVPDVPKNAASFLIARSVAMIRASGKWDCLVTYADEWQGHVGTIYRATNWRYAGLTAPETTFVSPDGRMSARKRGPKTFTRQEMLDSGHTDAGKHAKHKYVMVL